MFKIESSCQGRTVSKEYRRTLESSKNLARRGAIHDTTRGNHESRIFEKVWTGGREESWELVASIEGTSGGQIVRVVPADGRPSVEYAREEIKRLQELVNLAIRHERSF